VSTTTIAPVVRSIDVEASLEHAFRVFTDEFGTWWPTATYSIGLEQVETAAIEPRVGGRVYERWPDGTELPWGEVRAWEPPRRLVLGWHPSRDPDHPVTEIEVTFEPIDGGTRVVLEHRGWEAYADSASDVRGEYDSGWPLVLGSYADKARG
jgi:uncharacterized protein YndB with AHSA1/START domain